MTNRLPVVICDLDGTIVNYAAEVCTFIFQTTGVALTPENCWTYLIHEAFYPYLCSTNGDDGLFASARAVKAFLYQNCYHNPDLLRRAKPYWSLWQALIKFMEIGGDVVILTARERELHGIRDATEAWLTQWLPAAHAVFYARSFDGEDTAERKLAACWAIATMAADTLEKPLGPYVLIDDCPDVILHAAENTDRNWTLLMPRRPWTIKSIGHPKIYHKSPGMSAHAYIESLTTAYGDGKNGCADPSA